VGWVFRNAAGTTIDEPTRHRGGTMKYLALLLLAGCFDAIQAPRDVTWFAPPAYYADLWRADLECAGATGDMGRLTFYAVPGESFTSSRGERVWGEWISPHTIYVAAVRAHSGYLIRHEMLHDILNGDPDHSSPLWQKCGVR
jgi:hypothetical protein